jgi:CRISPR-associated protein Cas2
MTHGNVDFMNTLVVYDITSNRIRGKVADACLDYGMLRIQKSAFLGDMNRNRQEGLMVRIERILEKKKGNVQMFSICDKDMKDRKETVNP